MIKKLLLKILLYCAKRYFPLDLKCDICFCAVSTQDYHMNTKSDFKEPKQPGSLPDHIRDHAISIINKNVIKRYKYKKCPKCSGSRLKCINQYNEAVPCDRCIDSRSVYLEFLEYTKKCNSLAFYTYWISKKYLPEPITNPVLMS